jgi:hypothetical protein
MMDFLLFICYLKSNFILSCVCSNHANAIVIVAAWLLDSNRGIKQGPGMPFDTDPGMLLSFSAEGRRLITYFYPLLLYSMHETF